MPASLCPYVPAVGSVTNFAILLKSQLAELYNLLVHIFRIQHAVVILRPMAFAAEQSIQVVRLSLD